MIQPEHAAAMGCGDAPRPACMSSVGVADVCEVELAAHTAAECTSHGTRGQGSLHGPWTPTIPDLTMQPSAVCLPRSLQLVVVAPDRKHSSSFANSCNRSSHAFHHGAEGVFQRGSGETTSLAASVGFPSGAVWPLNLAHCFAGHGRRQEERAGRLEGDGRLSKNPCWSQACPSCLM